MDSAPEKTLGISGPVTGRTNHSCLGSCPSVWGSDSRSAPEVRVVH